MIKLPKLGALERIALVTIVAAVGIIVLKVVGRWGLWTVWDDAWMFQRYAANVIAGHGVAWNAGEPPTYGLTPLLYLLPSLVSGLIFGNPAVAVLVSSVVSGVLLLIGAAWMIAATDGRRSARWLAYALFIASFAASHGPEHFVSGMDTMFGAAYLAVLIGWAQRWQKRQGRAETVLLGMFAALALWVRPELGLYGAAIAGCAVAWPPRRRKRRDALALAIVMGLGIALLMLVAKLYFGTALPLPFHTKTSGLYGAEFLRTYRGETTNALGQFLPFLWALVGVVAIDFAVGPRRYLARAGALERASLLATLAFIAFHWFFAIPIMGMIGRYYQPAVVPLAYLAAQSLGRLHTLVRASFPANASRAAWAGVVTLGALALWPTLLPQAKDELATIAGWLKARRHHDIYHHAKGGPETYWARLDQLRNFDGSLTIASTEVGFLSVHQSDKRIIDIAGLNDRRFAFSFDAATLLEGDEPDLIYMPHPHYVDMVEAIRAHPSFETRYLEYSRQRLGAREFGVAIRRDSPHFETLKKVFGSSRNMRPLQTVD